MRLDSDDAEDLNFNGLVDFGVRYDCHALHRAFDELAEVQAHGGACQDDGGVALIGELFQFVVQGSNHAAHRIGVEAYV